MIYMMEHSNSLQCQYYIVNSVPQLQIKDLEQLSNTSMEYHSHSNPNLINIMNYLS